MRHQSGRALAVLSATTLALTVGGGHALADQGKSARSGGGGQAPKGNNGTVKIDEYPMDSGSDNDPHVGCPFSVSFFGYDAGHQSATMTFTPQSPTSGGHSVTYRTSWDTAHRSGGNQLDANYEVSSLGSALDGVTPAKQGYHIKLTVEVTGSQGSGAKHKVFWMAPCSSSQSGSTTQPASPSGANSGGSGTAVAADHDQATDNDSQADHDQATDNDSRADHDQATDNDSRADHDQATDNDTSGSVGSGGGSTAGSAPPAGSALPALSAPQLGGGQPSASGLTVASPTRAGTTSSPGAPGTQVLGLSLTRPGATTPATATATGAGGGGATAALAAAPAGAARTGAMPFALPFTGFSAMGAVAWAALLTGLGALCTTASRRNWLAHLTRGRSGRP